MRLLEQAQQVHRALSLSQNHWYCLVTFAFTIGFAKVVGARQPPHSALAGFREGCQGKPQPCWYGIVPGVMTLNTAEQLMRRVTYYQLGPADEQSEHSAQYLYPGYVYSLNIYANQDNVVQAIEIDLMYEVIARLSDIIFVWGLPTSFNYYSSDQSGMTANQVWFSSNGVVYTAEFDVTPSQALNSNLNRIVLSLSQGDGRIWYGFVPSWWYCQREVETFGCS